MWFVIKDSLSHSTLVVDYHLQSSGWSSTYSHYNALQSLTFSIISSTFQLIIFQVTSTIWIWIWIFITGFTTIQCILWYLLWNITLNWTFIERSQSISKSQNDLHYEWFKLLNEWMCLRLRQSTSKRSQLCKTWCPYWH